MSVHCDRSTAGLVCLLDSDLPAPRPRSQAGFQAPGEPLEYEAPWRDVCRASDKANGVLPAASWPSQVHWLFRKRLSRCQVCSRSTTSGALPRRPLAGQSHSSSPDVSADSSRSWKTQAPSKAGSFSVSDFMLLFFKQAFLKVFPLHMPHRSLPPPFPAFFLC